MAAKKVAVKKAAVAVAPAKAAVAAAAKKEAVAVAPEASKAIVNFDASNPAKFLNQNQFSIAQLRKACDCTGIEDENVRAHVETNIRYGRITEKHFN